MNQQGSNSKAIDPVFVLQDVKANLQSMSPNFDHGAQRNRLLKSGIIRLFITATVCALIAVTMQQYDTLDRGITSSERRGFNTLIVAFSMILSLILFHSLEWGAQVVRWRILASKFLSPEEFNLIYDCDRKLSDLRLLWVARTPGRLRPNKIQLLVLLYLAISIGLLVDTALLSLTYSVDVSPYYKMSKPGAISVANLTQISLTKDTAQPQYQQAQNYGLISQGFVPLESTIENGVPGRGSLLSVQFNADQTLFWYRFVDMSVSDLSQYDLSDRYITSNASCYEVRVISGGHGGPTNLTAEEQTNATTIQIQDGDSPIQDIYLGEFQAPGGITWLGSIDMGSGQCGPRCAHIWVLQSGLDVPGRESPRFWKCNNTISPLMNAGKYANAASFDMPDKWAQVMAGAIGFSGIPAEGLPYQRVVYGDGGLFTPLNNESNAHFIELTIMWFSVGGFSAMDAFGRRVNITSNEEPIPAQVLDVKWKYTAVTLAIPPLVQAMVLVAVILYGSKTVIRGGDALSTAELLRPVIDTLSQQVPLSSGTQGTGDQARTSKIRYRPRGDGGVEESPFGGSASHMEIMEVDKQPL